MRIELSWISGKKEYRYAGLVGAHASGEREAVDIEGGELVYTRSFRNGAACGTAIVGYTAQPGEPVAPLGEALPVSHGAIPLTATVRAEREVVATAEELEQLDGIGVEGEAGQRWVRGATGLHYVNASGGESGDDGDRQSEPDGPVKDDPLGGFGDIFAQLNESVVGKSTEMTRDDASDTARRFAADDWFGLGR